MQSNRSLSITPIPSFDHSSSDKLVEIASRVVEGFIKESESDTEFDDFIDFKFEEKSSDAAEVQPRIEEVEEKAISSEEDDEDFEFPFVCSGPGSSPVSADEIFYNGQIKPVYTLFNREFSSHVEKVGVTSSKSPTRSSIRLPLRKLLFEDRELPTCSSSSEADDLKGIQPESYCVWTPKSIEESPERCKKRNSTESSKRWKFRDLLHRSNSDGDDTFVSLNPSNGNAGKKEINAAEKTTAEKSPADLKVAGKAKDRYRRRLFLPYRQSLGFLLP